MSKADKIILSTRFVVIAMIAAFLVFAIAFANAKTPEVVDAAAIQNSVRITYQDACPEIVWDEVPGATGCIVQIADDEPVVLDYPITSMSFYNVDDENIKLTVVTPNQQIVVYDNVLPQ